MKSWTVVPITNSIDPDGFFGEDDISFNVYFDFIPGRPATYFDPPEYPEVDILEMEFMDGKKVNIENLPDEIYENMASFIVDEMERDF